MEQFDGGLGVRGRSWWHAPLEGGTGETAASGCAFCRGGRRWRGLIALCVRVRLCMCVVERVPTVVGKRDMTPALLTTADARIVAPLACLL